MRQPLYLIDNGKIYDVSDRFDKTPKWYSAITSTILVIAAAYLGFHLMMWFFKF